MKTALRCAAFAAAVAALMLLPAYVMAPLAALCFLAALKSAVTNGAKAIVALTAALLFALLLRGGL